MEFLTAPLLMTGEGSRERSPSPCAAVVIFERSEKSTRGAIFPGVESPPTPYMPPIDNH